MNAVDHLEGALERLTRGDITALPPARRRRLQAILGAWASVCENTANRPPGDETFVDRDGVVRPAFSDTPKGRPS